MDVSHLDFSPREKLKYLCATYAQNKDKLEEIIETVKEIVSGCKGIIFPNADWNDESEFFYGEIDHQSIGILDGYLENHNITFKEFLLNKRYSIIVDGDEHGIWDTVKESGIVNIEEIEMEISDWNDGSWGESEGE